MRDRRMDFCKGIGILLMVAGHAGIPDSSMIFRFHMALFFIVSGYLFDNRKTDSIGKLGKYTLRRVVSLYLPFIFWNGLLLLMTNVLIRIHFYTDNPLFLEAPDLAGAAGNAYGLKSFLSHGDMLNAVKKILLFQWEQQLGGATWFLRVMFGLTLLWAALNYIIIKVSRGSLTVQWLVNLLISGALLVLSNHFQETGTVSLPLQFETIAASYIMFFLGYSLKLFMKNNSMPEDWKVKTAFLALSLICLISCDRVCRLLGWNSNPNNYNDWTMYIVSSLAGFFSVFFLADLLCGCTNVIIRKAVALFSQMGKSSLYILAVHFAAFKAVTAIQLAVFNQPAYRLASFPTFYNRDYWWVAYTVAGVAIPMLIKYGMDGLKKVILPRIKKA